MPGQWQPGPGQIPVSGSPVPVKPRSVDRLVPVSGVVNGSLVLVQAPARILPGICLSCTRVQDMLQAIFASQMGGGYRRARVKWGWGYRRARERAACISTQKALKAFGASRK